MKIFNKIAFVSFETNDWNNGIFVPLDGVLKKQVLGIVSVHMIQKLVENDPKFSEYLKKRVWTLFSSKDGTLYVIVPESIDNVETVQKNNGFKNLVGPIIDLKPLKPATPEHNPDQMINNFIEIIDEKSPNHPQEFILEGHGFPGLIAAIPVTFFGKFLKGVIRY